MQCHKAHLPAAANRDPHDLSPEMWQRLKEAADVPFQLVSTRAPGQASDDLATSTGESDDTLAKNQLCHVSQRTSRPRFRYQTN